MMSRFEAHIEAAQAKQRRTFWFASLGAAGLVMTLSMFVFLTRGLAVEVAPKEASEQAKLAIKQGVGFTIGKKVYAFGEVVFQLSSPGFITQLLTVSADKQRKFIEVVMQEAPAQLSVTTEPALPTTRWYLNEVLTHTGEALLKQNLKAGEYALRIDNPYYQVETFTITAARSEEVARSVALRPAQGQLEVRSTPVGAKISINDEVKGKTPSMFTLSGGAYTVTIDHPDYKSMVDDSVEITNTHTILSRDYRLSQQDSWVRFDLTPPDGKLLLNGKLVKSAELTVAANRQYTAIYAKPGYQSASKNFKLLPGVKRQITITLSQEVGEVEIVSEPSATVLIDGRQVGFTPMTLELPTVAHEITIEKEGYRSVKQTLVPSATNRKKIDLRLKPELQARLKAGAVTYKNQAGIIMRLFPLSKPALFEMGAPRGEKGQRANEFQRKVKLTKPFYVALYETTVAQFSQYKAVPGQPKEPVTQVSWLEAAGFCNWLSAKEGLRPFYLLQDGRYLGADPRADGYRLPTEAEWEWLARKAKRSQQTRFTWGNDAKAIPPSAGNLADQSTKGQLPSYIPKYSDGYAGLAPVGKFAARAGIYDLSGNVSEWVHDVYLLSPPTPRVIEKDPMSVGDGPRMLKGSNWRSASLTELRAAYRDTAEGGRNDLGFRIARYVANKGEKDQ